LASFIASTNLLIAIVFLNISSSPGRREITSEEAIAGKLGRLELHHPALSRSESPKKNRTEKQSLPWTSLRRGRLMG
jgi:hypothetical protein